MNNALIKNALSIANKGIQINDGHQYMVPAHDIVEYAETIKALVAALDEQFALGYDAGYSDAVRDENEDNR